MQFFAARNALSGRWSSKFQLVNCSYLEEVTPRAGTYLLTEVLGKATLHGLQLRSAFRAAKQLTSRISSPEVTREQVLTYLLKCSARPHCMDYSFEVHSEQQIPASQLLLPRGNCTEPTANSTKVPVW